MMHVHPSDREAKLDAVYEKLTSAVTALVTGDDWRRALEFATHFRSRSFNNTLLIYAQHYAAFEKGNVPEPTPSYVAGFNQWLSLGRHVAKGQSGYQILAPVTARYASPTPDPDGSWRRLARGERPSPRETVRSRMIGLRPAYVFDLSQTNGTPIPERQRPQLLQGQAPAGLWDGLDAEVEARGFALRGVPDAGVIGGANGLTDYLAKQVSVRADMDPAAQVKTLAHELAHVMLHGPANADAVQHRGVAEVEAESVALMIGAAHGMDTSDYTVPYVSSWAENVAGKNPVDVVKATAERVRAAVVEVLDHLDTHQVDGGDPPGLERAVSRSAGRESSMGLPVEASGPGAVVGL
jgi:antirestriction protein ArdC